MTTVHVGDRDYTIEPFTGRKATRALRLLKDISRAVPEIIDERATFRRDYAERNVVELDRVQARHEFGDTLDHWTDADWEAAGGKLRLHRAPTMQEELLAVFPTALERSEDLVGQLLALCTYTNEEVAKFVRDGSLNDTGVEGATPGKLTERASELLDKGDLRELAQLAVAAAEVIDEQFATIKSELGDRAGKALRLFGIGRPEPTTSTPEPTSETPSPTPPSSGDTDEPASASEPASSTSPTEPSLT